MVGPIMRIDAVLCRKQTKYNNLNGAHGFNLSHDKSIKESDLRTEYFEGCLCLLCPPHLKDICFDEQEIKLIY